MKKILISLAALGVMGAAAAPAAAQPWRDDGRFYHQDYRGDRLSTRYVDSLDWRITNAAHDGRISWGEAREMRGDLRSVHDLAWRNETGGIRPWEYRRLSDTVRRIEVRTSDYGWRDGGRPYDWRR
jgi:hypothetical protein